MRRLLFLVGAFLAGALVVGMLAGGALYLYFERPWDRTERVLAPIPTAVACPSRRP
ncbi:hypothetical protein ACU686_18690 [Yinghuangia aomiensis]